MDNNTMHVIIAVATVIGLLIICNSQYPISIRVKFKEFNIEIGTKKEDK
jgi:hypothetical protein